MFVEGERLCHGTMAQWPVQAYYRAQCRATALIKTDGYNLISEFRKKRLVHLAEASPKELWNAV